LLSYISILELVIITPNDKGQDQRSRSKFCQVIILIKTVCLEYLLPDQLQTWYESSIYSATQLIRFESRSTLSFMVSYWVENGVSQGQILKWEEPSRVVPHMEGRDECFLNQQTF
jgi:hypothetical protein